MKITLKHQKCNIQIRNGCAKVKRVDQGKTNLFHSILFLSNSRNSNLSMFLIYFDRLSVNILTDNDTNIFITLVDTLGSNVTFTHFNICQKCQNVSGTIWPACLKQDCSIVKDLMLMVFLVLNGHEWSQKWTVSQFYETWHQCLSHNKSGPTANACFRQTNEPRAKTRNIFYTIYSRHRWLNIFSQLLSRLIVTNCGSWQFKIKNQPGKQAKWASLATISLDWAILVLLVL